jgi:hypothetical protein
MKLKIGVFNSAKCECKFRMKYQGRRCNMQYDYSNLVWRLFELVLWRVLKRCVGVVGLTKVHKLISHCPLDLCNQDKVYQTTVTQPTPGYYSD